MGKVKVAGHWYQSANTQDTTNSIHIKPEGITWNWNWQL